MGGRNGALGVVGEIWRNFHTGVTVEPVGAVIDGFQHVERTVDVLQDHRPVVVDDRMIGTAHELGELLVVVGRALDGLLEDGGIRGEAANPAIDQLLELARGDVAALEVVEPRALAEFLGEGDETIHEVSLTSWPE
jgi:hypothetical protein